MNATMRSLLVLLLPAVGFAYNWNCNLYCYNGGECNHGKGRFGSYGNVDEETPWEAKAHVEGMYCICPVGYVGLQCEISLNVCGLANNNDDHICHNGSECLKEKSGYGKTYYHCECDTDTVYESPYVAKYCEHIGTIFCGHNKNDDSFSSSQFCTNGGRCKEPDEDGTKHPGCDCPEGWEGLHCTEKAEGDWVEKGKEELWNAATAQNIAGFVFLGLAIVALGYGAYRLLQRRKKRRRRRREVQEEVEFGTGLIRKKRGGPGRMSGRKSGKKPSTARPSNASAAPRGNDAVGLTSFKDEPASEGENAGTNEII